jgi:hypothetical protein
MGITGFLEFQMCESVGVICNFERDDILKDRCIHCSEAALSYRMFDL